MAGGNSHEMAFRQSRTPDELQARTNTTLRSLHRAVIVIVSPVVGVLGDAMGYGSTVRAAAAIFAASTLLLTFSPLRRARVE